jgi:hypothetical protein
MTDASVLHRAGSTPLELRVRAFAGCRQCLAHGPHVRRPARVVGELDRPSRDLQKGTLRVGIAVADGLAQSAEGHAQVAQRLHFGPVGPQQAGQGVAAMGCAGVHCQVGQQRPRRVRKVGHRLAVQRDLERAEQGKRQVSHRPFSCNTPQSKTIRFLYFSCALLRSYSILRS